MASLVSIAAVVWVVTGCQVDHGKVVGIYYLVDFDLRPWTNQFP